MVITSLALAAFAQTSPRRLPPGIWEGSVLFNGTHDTVFSEGTHTVREVTASSINFEMLVDQQGHVIDGEMEVDISWIQDTTGTAPSTDAPVHIFSEQRQTGVLTLSGDAARISAAGTLDWETMTYDTEGDLIEEVSGTEPEEVEWAFQAFQVDCAGISGRLIETKGLSLIGSAVGPQVVFDDGFEVVHDLVALLWAWPQFSDPSVMADAVLEVTEAAEEILSGTPTVEEIEQLVRLIEAVRLELSRLEACRIPVEGFVPQYNDSFLASLLRQALKAALDLGEYSAQELISLLNLAARGQAINAELHEQFGQSLDQALDHAAEAGDFDTIRDIAAAAGRYGYPDLYAEANDLLEEEEG
jgi:hypothetical protein